MGKSCCSSSPPEIEEGHPSTLTIVCPSCEQKGRKVGHLTLQAMLAVSLEVIDETSRYRFCSSADCGVVYFDEQGMIFGEKALRERVYQKHPECEDSFVCYCYRHTIGSIRDDLLLDGQTDVVERVTTGTKAGSCACEIRNPQGNCCLGNVRAVVKRLKASLMAQY